jgi:hypothetical protein
MSSADPEYVMIQTGLLSYIKNLGSRPQTKSVTELIKMASELHTALQVVINLKNTQKPYQVESAAAMETWKEFQRLYFPTYAGGARRNRKRSTRQKKRKGRKTRRHY